MAKAEGGKGILGAIKAAGLRLAMGMAGSKLQQENQSMLSAMMARVGHMIPFLGDALGRGKGSKNALANLLEVAKTMEVVITRHQQTRAKLQREAKERLELKTPTPTAATKPQPRRAVPQAAPLPAPKPTFVE